MPFHILLEVVVMVVAQVADAQILRVLINDSSNRELDDEANLVFGAQTNFSYSLDSRCTPALWYGPADTFGQSSASAHSAF